MRKKFRGFTLIELLVVIAIIALLISILLPSLSRARELSKRLVCGSNTKGIGTSCKIYANDNNERWPVPPFEASATRGTSGTGIIYTNPGTEPAGVGYVRNFPSTSASATNRADGSLSLSVTRAFWMLVRSGDVTVKQFICPSSGDQPDPTDNLDVYYDFTSIENVSYGYQVPWGPRDTVPREGMDNRAAMVADRGPFSSNCNTPDWLDPAGIELTQKSSPKDWRRFNSTNHGGNGNGEGQNVLFADGHSSFEKKPIVGIDSDNIYTLQTPDWSLLRTNLIHGEPPCNAGVTNPYPGQQALPGRAWTSTDSMIWP
jgi:prepilin-type N-terminal cleavage/methylation domain-containing protein/prepilin-type processing-associated H-X9-DG protein